jgi:hypothetical protein
MGFGYFPYIYPDGNNPIIRDVNGNVIAKFDYSSSTMSKLYGQVASTDDLQIYANQTDTLPSIRLNGNAGTNILLAAGNSLKLYDTTNEFMNIYLGVTDSNIEGGDATGDDLYLSANSVDTFPMIEMHGNGGINYKMATGCGLWVYNATTNFMYFEYTGSIATIGTFSNGDLQFIPNGSGKVRFGTYAALGGKALAGYIEIKDQAGNTRYLGCVA